MIHLFSIFIWPFNFVNSD